MADFTEKEEQQIWEKAQKVAGYDETKWRKDVCGAWMKRNAYGDRSHKYGWEIDHAYPKAKKEINENWNLRAMHWENNMSKDTDYPKYETAVVAKDNSNIAKVVRKVVPESIQEKVKAWLSRN